MLHFATKQQQAACLHKIKPTLLCTSLTRTLRGVAFFSTSPPHQNSFSDVPLHPVSFTVTFPLLIPPPCLTTLHIVHTSPAVPPQLPRKPGKHDVGHLPSTWSRDCQGSSLAPPPTQPSTSASVLLLSHFTTRHMSCHAYTPPPPPSLLSRVRPPLLLAGCYCSHWQVPDASRLWLLSTNSGQPLFSRQPVMSPVHLQRAVCVMGDRCVCTCRLLLHHHNGRSFTALPTPGHT